MPIPRVLAIAGSDSGGGAGIQADIRTVVALGGYCATAITAVTAQNTLGVARIEVLSPPMVIAQIDAVLDDIGADAIKIGMIGSSAVAESVADRLERARPCGAIVVDPVMVATSGSVLADADTVAASERLMRLATLVTPNLPELASLSGIDEAALEDIDRLKSAAFAMARRLNSAVLVKGGHGCGATVADRLFLPNGGRATWRAQRIETRHTHGTGCTLSSAIATRLAGGAGLNSAIEDAQRYVRAALRSSPGLGMGHGPLGYVQAPRPVNER